MHLPVCTEIVRLHQLVSMLLTCVKCLSFDLTSLFRYGYPCILEKHTYACGKKITGCIEQVNARRKFVALWKADIHTNVVWWTGAFKQVTLTTNL